MMRNATISRHPEDQSYEVVLFENNQVVHRKKYQDGEYQQAVLTKESWLNGQGPEFLAG